MQCASWPRLSQRFGFRLGGRRHNAKHLDAISTDTHIDQVVIRSKLSMGEISPPILTGG